MACALNCCAVLFKCQWQGTLRGEQHKELCFWLGAAWGAVVAFVVPFWCAVLAFVGPCWCAVLALLFLVGVLFSPLSFLVGRKETRRRHEIPTQLLEVCLTSMMLESSLRCAMTAIG